MAKNTSRRNFLRTVPVAAAISLSLPSITDQLLAQAAVGGAPGADVATAALPFQMFTAKALDDDAKALLAKPGNNNLMMQAAGFPCAIVMTTEVHHSATEFEWHEGRDHILQIVDGSTLYEVGGVPKNGHSTGKPGEWLAPASEGSKSILMGKGDMLVLPRGTPHRRSTEDSVTLILISPYGTMKA
jgi:mannose-6-phosphate isomerase-like protein (cupin superfamily)